MFRTSRDAMMVALAVNKTRKRKYIKNKVSIKIEKVENNIYGKSKIYDKPAKCEVSPYNLWRAPSPAKKKFCMKS